MKKIISLLSVFALIATMFTTVAMADENNYLKWEIKSSSATSLTADLVLKTSHALNQVQGTLKLANAKKNGLKSVTFTQTEGGKIGASAKTTLSIAYASDVDIPAGEYVIGTVTLNFNEGSSYKLNEVARAVKLASMSEDFTSEFTNGFFDLEFPAKSEEPKFTPAAGGEQYGQKTYIPGIISVDLSKAADAKVKITDEANVSREVALADYVPALSGEGSINLLAIVRYAGETDKTFTIEVVE